MLKEVEHARKWLLVIWFTGASGRRVGGREKKTRVKGRGGDGGPLYYCCFG